MAYGLSMKCNAQREQAEFDQLTFGTIGREIVQLNDRLCELSQLRLTVVAQQQWEKHLQVHEQQTHHSSQTRKLTRLLLQPTGQQPVNRYIYT